jgi:GT2 family glycosyltransferase
MKKVKVEIVTTVHNRRELTLQCLRSLSRIDRAGLDVHVIIVDDGSTDGTAEAVRAEFPEVEIVAGDGNLWYTGGINRGLTAALKRDPKYILAINDDEVFDEKFLRAMVETAEKHPRSVVGAVLLLWDAPHRVFQVAPRLDTWAGGWRHWQRQTVWTLPPKPFEVELIVGNCVLYPAEAVRECGLMDEKRFVQFGDAEYTPRMRRRGWRLLIEPRARVFCQPNDAPPKIRRMNFGQMLNALVFDLKNIHNLRKRFYVHWFTAPNRLTGTAAFFIFLFRALLGKSSERVTGEPEKHLAEVFAKAQVKD